MSTQISELQNLRVSTKNLRSSWRKLDKHLGSFIPLVTWARLPLYVLPLRQHRTASQQHSSDNEGPPKKIQILCNKATVMTLQWEQSSVTPILWSQEAGWFRDLTNTLEWEEGRWEPRLYPTISLWSTAYNRWRSQAFTSHCTWHNLPCVSTCHWFAVSNPPQANCSKDEWSYSTVMQQVTYLTTYFSFVCSFTSISAPGFLVFYSVFQIKIKYSP